MPALCVTIWKYFDRCIFLCPATLWLGWTPWLNKNWTVSQARHEALLLISLQGTERPQRLIQNASYRKTASSCGENSSENECRVSQCSGAHIWAQGLRAIALTRHTHTWQPLSPLPAVCSVGQHCQSKDTSFILQSLKATGKRPMHLGTDSFAFVIWTWHCIWARHRPRTSDVAQTQKRAGLHLVKLHKTKKALTPFNA